jgi:hypothetical protein
MIFWYRCEHLVCMLSGRICIHDQSNFEDFVQTAKTLTDQDFLHDIQVLKETTCGECWRLEWPDLTDGGARIRDIYQYHTVPLRATGNPRADQFRNFPVVYVTHRLVESVVCRGWFKSIKYLIGDCGIDVNTTDCMYGHRSLNPKPVNT